MADELKSELNEGEMMIEIIARRLAEVVPPKLVAPEERKPMADQTVAFLGALVEFMGKAGPMTRPMAAALLYFTNSLNLSGVGEDNAFVVLALVEACRNAAEELRKARN